MPIRLYIAEKILSPNSAFVNRPGKIAHLNCGGERKKKQGIRLFLLRKRVKITKKRGAVFL